MATCGNNRTGRAGYFEVPHRITGHRGSGANHTVSRARENTTASCLLSLANGADSVEIDAQCSSDGELVVYHDPYTPDGQRLAAQTYRELRNHGIERLVDLAAQLPSHNGTTPVGINVELKTGYDLADRAAESQLDHRIADAIVTRLPALTSRHTVLLSSFDPVVLGRYRFLREHDATIVVPFSFISAHPHPRDQVTTVTAHTAILTAQELGADAIHLNTGQLGLGPVENDPEVGTFSTTTQPPSARIEAAVTTVGKAGLKLSVWCPEPADAALLLRAGAAGVCVNWVPETVAAVAGEAGRAATPVQAAQ